MHRKVGTNRDGMNPKPKNPAAVALGKLAGAVRTAAKSEASRINGRKGGRPKGGKNKPKQFGPLPE